MTKQKKVVKKKIKDYGEELEELINDIRQDGSVDSVHIHKYVRSLLKQIDKKPIIGYMYMEKWNKDCVSRFVYRKRPKDKVTFIKVKITPLI